jgi:hypothetical protein
MRRLEKKMVLKATIYDGTGNPWKYLDSQGAKDMVTRKEVLYLIELVRCSITLQM